MGAAVDYWCVSSDDLAGGDDDPDGAALWEKDAWARAGDSP